MDKGCRHPACGPRCRICALRKSGLSIRAVARLLGVLASTVSRELRRNCGLRGYRMKQAQRLSEARRRQASSRPRKPAPELWRGIEGKLRPRWSLEKIVGRLRLDGGASVGKTWICRHARADRAGDWELDAIIGARHRGALVSMVDRCSKFTFLRRVERKTSAAAGPDPPAAGTAWG